MIVCNRKMLIVKKFNFSDIGLKKLRKNSNYKTPVENEQKYAYWVIDQLKEISNQPEGKIYNATSIYMNERNVDKLNDYIGGMAWLNYAPSECNDLKNNEYGVDLTSILEDKR